jgi:hypothetical protein
MLNSETMILSLVISMSETKLPSSVPSTLALPPRLELLLDMLVEGKKISA